MFKKKVSLGTESLISGKIIKKLSQKFALDKKATYKQAKVAGSKVTIIFKQDNTQWLPYLVDLGKDVFPTLFFLWEQEALPSIEISEEVSRFILNGANLMWPGVPNSEEISSLLVPDQWVCIKVRNNPKAFAVGIYKFEGVFSGLCVDVQHFFGDGISKILNIQPEGFSESGIRSIVEIEVVYRPIEETNTEEEKEEIKEIDDDTVEKILLTALKVGVTDDMLPIEPREILRIMHACKRKIPFDIKLTSFNKIGAFLAHAHKKKYLVYKVPNKKNNKMVLSVNRSHEDYVNVVPIVKKPVFPKPKTSNSEFPRVEYTSVFIPTEQLRIFLFENFGSSLSYYTDIKEYMKKYCEIKNLHGEDRSFQRANEELSAVLGVPEMEFPKAKIQDIFKEQFIKGYRRLTEESDDILEGPLPLIKLTEKISKWKRYNTICTGLFLFLIDEFELADEFKRAFGCTADVYEVKETSEYALVVQGRRSMHIKEIFLKKYKIPHRQIDIIIH